MAGGALATLAGDGPCGDTRDDRATDSSLSEWFAWVVGTALLNTQYAYIIPCCVSFAFPRGIPPNGSSTSVIYTPYWVQRSPELTPLLFDCVFFLLLTLLMSIWNLSRLYLPLRRCRVYSLPTTLPHSRVARSWKGTPHRSQIRWRRVRGSNTRANTGCTRSLR